MAEHLLDPTTSQSRVDHMDSSTSETVSYLIKVPFGILCIYNVGLFLLRTLQYSNTQAVAWVLLATFDQTYRQIGEKKEKILRFKFWSRGIMCKIEGQM